ncbi:MAG: 4Fe-4S binding protein [Promethearchaeota archaeon]
MIGANSASDSGKISDPPRIGVFVCHCGHNISSMVDIDSVVNAVKDLPNVEYATDYMFMCSKQGLQLMQKAIKEHNINRTVVASCSKRQHGPTFSNAIAEIGINKHMHFQVNVREGAAWVHSDKVKTTKKAIQLTRAGIARARKLEPVGTKQIPTTKAALVIGGGIAGLRAANDLADLDIPVFLIEKESSIGGHMVQLYKTFPTNECPQCSMSPLLNAVANHPNITLHTYSEVDTVHGDIGNFTATIKTKARYVNNNCISCGACANVCPVEVPSEWDKGMGMRKAVFKLFPQAIPGTFVIDKKSCIECKRCVKACPADAIDFSMKQKKFDINIGSIVVATGYEEYNPKEIEAYHYNEPGYEDVITQLQFERLMSPVSLTEGNLLRPSDSKIPKDVVVIQCVGSRMDNGLGKEYCTGVCCMYGNKNAGIVKDLIPKANVTMCYIDLRTPGLYYEEYLKSTQEKGVMYIRGRPSEIQKDPLTGQLYVIVQDTLCLRPLKILADLVLLSSAMVAPKGIGKLGSTLQILRSKAGFLKEFHLKMDPIKSTKPGIFIAGSIQGPKDITQSVAQGAGVVASAAIPLMKGYIEKEMEIASIDYSLCVNCKLCITVCPLGAFSMVDNRVVINESACKPCGLCQPACPTGAISIVNQREDELYDEIEGILIGGYENV